MYIKWLTTVVLLVLPIVLAAFLTADQFFADAGLSGVVGTNANAISYKGGL